MNNIQNEHEANTGNNMAYNTSGQPMVTLTIRLIMQGKVCIITVWFFSNQTFPLGLDMICKHWIESYSYYIYSKLMVHVPYIPFGHIMCSAQLIYLQQSRAS